MKMIATAAVETSVTNRLPEEYSNFYDHQHVPATLISNNSRNCILLITDSFVINASVFEIKVEMLPWM